jgi:putative peptidoglycan lipid II flippase
MGLFRSVATVGGYTMVSRVLGFAREILTAAMLGAGPLSDAFFVALRLPNLFRSLFAEGAFAQAFVPIFSGTLARDGRGAAIVFARDTFAVLLLALCLFLCAGEVFTPAILHLVAPGFERNPAQFRLVVNLTRITFPYLLFISLVSFLGGMLNAVDKFAANAASASLLNLFLIAALLFVRPLTDQALAWAVSLSGLAQFAWLAWSCGRAGLLAAPRLPKLTAEVRALLRIMLPGVFGAGATQINIMVSTAIASLAPSGSVSYLSYADRLNQLPLGVVAVAVATVILPRLSREIRAGNEAQALHTQNRGLELALLLTLPAAVALGLAAHPLLAVLFQRGAFDARAVDEVTPALMAYAAGLPAFVLTKVMVTGFLARRDTVTPVKIAIGVVVVNAALTVLLGVVLGFAHVGIAAATSICGWLNALSLIGVAYRRGHFRLDARCRRVVPRVVVAALGMGALLAVLERALAPALRGPALMRYASLAGLVSAGLLGFAALVLALRVVDWHELRSGRVRPA